MTDDSRINKTFYKHPKVKKARAKEPGSISLWLLANCWCRNHRKQGFIPRDKALELGSEAEIEALIDACLWRAVEGGYQFKDWTNWNPDMLSSGPHTSAIFIVQTTLTQHPKGTQDRLADEVQKLIEEGIPRDAIEAGVRKWGERKDARFSWLPYFVSDVIRESESGITAAIKEARRTGNVAALQEYGFRYQAPDTPDDLRSARAIREFGRKQKDIWLDSIEASIGSEPTTQRRTS